ncbi:uncharacterized protein LOC107885861, partial [Acyrthosiphon pisum]|uniref:Secreted protein n=1 Tax=Acyrthosiphon pisum TaxID=7029 RepID=A0A8R2HBQ3_ACYPI
MSLIFALFYLTFITVCKLAEEIMRKVHLEHLQNGDCRYKSEDAPTSASPSRKDKFAQVNIWGPCAPYRRGRVMYSSRPNNGTESEPAAVRSRCTSTAPTFPARIMADHRFRCTSTAPTFPARNVVDHRFRCTPTAPTFPARNMADHRFRCTSTAPTFPAQNVADHRFS